jgi:type I restriction enzyme M protein
VIGLGPNLFYNSPMEACLLITKTNKAASRKGKVLIINAVKEVKQDKNIAYLEGQHIERIYNAYKSFSDDAGFCKVVDVKEVLSHNASLNMSLYVSNVDTSKLQVSLNVALQNWTDSSINLKKSMDELFKVLG